MNSNPYLPPAEIEGDSPQKSSTFDFDSSPAKFLIRWPVVLLVNLIVPLMLASGILQETQYFGVFVAVFLVWFCGWWGWRRWPEIGRRLIAGGWVVCVCQLFPLIQIFAGLTALTTAEALGLTDSLDIDVNGPQLKSEFASGFITLVTGGILMMVSLAVGTVVIAVLDSVRKPKPV